VHGLDLTLQFGNLPVELLQVREQPIEQRAQDAWQSVPLHFGAVASIWFNGS